MCCVCCDECVVLSVCCCGVCVRVCCDEMSVCVL